MADVLHKVRRERGEERRGRGKREREGGMRQGHSRHSG
jgi:hypothetical protein